MSIPLPNNRHFADISGFQPSVNWNIYKSFSDMVAMKASEGIGFQDPTFVSHRSGALAAGLTTIWYYHYARPDLGNSATAEAEYFHSIVGSVRPSDRVILDIEVTGATGGWSLQFLQALERLYPSQVGVYTYLSYIPQNLSNPAFARYPLWLAAYGGLEPRAPAPWQSLSAWQFTDRFQVPGIPAPCDCSVLLEASMQNWNAINTMIVELWASQEAYFKAIGQALPPRDTGIFGVWRNELLSGRYRGVPLSGEYTMTDPDGSGDPCVAQNFAGGTCRWNKRTNQATWI